MPSRARLTWFVAIAALFLVAVALLSERRKEQGDRNARAIALVGGDIGRGRAKFSAYGCGGCHSVEGVPQARGRVGPPLDGIGGRAMLAGRLENTPSNLMRWIHDPQAVSPGTAMPRLGVTPAEARDIATFLYTRD